MNYQLTINGKDFDVTIASITGSTARVLVNGSPYDVRIGQRAGSGSAPSMQDPALPRSVSPASPSSVPQQAAPVISAVQDETPAEGEAILAPMPGLILEVKVKVGQLVVAGETIAVMEAMKMENNLVAHVAGTVKEIRVEKGKEVSTGDIIMVIG
ncbi:MAG: biotin/lipoyl-containing protein [Thermodesulfobacteriota bacterium]